MAWRRGRDARKFHFSTRAPRCPIVSIEVDPDGQLDLAKASQHILEECLRQIERSETMLSEAEVQYLKTQRLARIATVSPKGQPEVSPVGFETDGKCFFVGSHDQSIFTKTRRYRNITAGNNRVSLVIDDLISVDPWRPRGIKISGTADVVEHDGIFGKGNYFRITPKVTISWGIEPAKEGQWYSKKTY